MMFLFKIGFLPVTIWDILDIIIVGYLLFQLYKLLRGSRALNIFVGVFLLYIVWWLVNQLGMDLLSAVLDQFVSVGVIVLIIIFQPEVRRFLLLLGNSTLRQRSRFFERILDRNFEGAELRKNQIGAIKQALMRMSHRKTGALIVFVRQANLEGIISGGLPLDALISEQLIVSIFQKESPLHDGALLIGAGKIQMASCVLPVSDNPAIPASAGLRHRAAVGITERADVVAFVVSEENGKLSYTYDGQLQRGLTEEELEELLGRYYV
jgi:diadenylate cyclase